MGFEQQAKFQKLDEKMPQNQQKQQQQQQPKFSLDENSVNQSLSGWILNLLNLDEEKPPSDPKYQNIKITISQNFSIFQVSPLTN